MDPGQISYPNIYPRQFLSLQEAADILGMSEVFVRRHKDEIGAYKFGRFWKIHVSNLRRWIDECFQGREVLALAKKDSRDKVIQPGHIPNEQRGHRGRDQRGRRIPENGEISLPIKESSWLHPSHPDPFGLRAAAREALQIRGPSPGRKNTMGKSSSGSRACGKSEDSPKKTNDPSA